METHEIVKSYHLWLPKELYEKVSLLAEVEKKTLNQILVECVEVALSA